MGRAEAKFASLAAYKFIVPFPFGDISPSNIESPTRSPKFGKTQVRGIRHRLDIVDGSNPLESLVLNMPSPETLMNVHIICKTLSFCS